MIVILAMIGCDGMFDSFGGADKKIEELPLMISAIKTAQVENYDLLGFYVEAEPYPKKPSSDLKKWEISSSGGFKDLAWSPGPEVKGVYGSYSIKVTGDDFVVIGVSDIDGDGVFATYTATKDTDPKVKTDKGIY